MQTYPYTPPQAALPAKLRLLRQALGVSAAQLARDTGLTRVTVAAAEGNADARISTVMTLLDALGYTLVPVPKALVNEVAAFVANGGQVVSKPVGTAAPVNESLAAYRNQRRMAESQDGGDDDEFAS